MLTTPFEYIDSITYTKEDLSDPYTIDSDYNTYLINRGLSFNLDCVFLVQEMNKYYMLPKQTQYHFLLNSIDKKKRYGKWVRSDSMPDDVKIIKEIYGYNDQKALSVLELLSDKDLLELRKINNKGGKL